MILRSGAVGALRALRPQAHRISGRTFAREAKAGPNMPPPPPQRNSATYNRALTIGYVAVTASGGIMLLNAYYSQWFS